ncbi:hypothetical protein NQ315_002623 [Exocentrus adspersus]|uniref:Uncharacterized protein n=1 Tax=Exocentrus adspersus TaxID=1586481 RepID=A0AAV8VUN2_9CUCU|nr:hypothetical protein NQ315_002623 [Exocentrus adspersus]
MYESERQSTLATPFKSFTFVFFVSNKSTVSKQFLLSRKQGQGDSYLRATRFRSISFVSLVSIHLNPIVATYL